ncbi:MAG TPA: hypothetical protein VKX46_20445 [Ktedonobacteraceae bacterium]|nr:hypothetical protein [Ktedonobacteraceae bacterium]
MSTTICPLCEYTNTSSSITCVNCGASLPNYAFTAGDEEEQAIIPYQSSTLAPAPVGENPYGPNREMQIAAPPPTIFDTAVIEAKNVDVIDPDLWQTDRLPWYWPRRRPQLVGKIVHIRNEMEFPDFPNILRAIIDMMVEILWIAANQPAHKEGERVQITIVRLRINGGQLKDARLMGYMRGANLSLGDVVSFWGWKRRGSLMVKRGYNHTSQAIITTNMMSMLVPGLILIALGCAIFLFSGYEARLLAFLHLFWH